MLLLTQFVLLLVLFSKAFHFLRGRGMQCGSSCGCVFVSSQNVIRVYCIYLSQGQILQINKQMGSRQYMHIEIRG